MIDMAIISTLAGGIGRLATEWLHARNVDKDNAHELAMVDKQIQLAQAQSDLKVKEAVSTAEINLDQTWANAIGTALDKQMQITGDKFLDRLNFSVRPVLTYWWCMLLYSLYKGVIIMMWVRSPEGSLGELATILITEFDMSIIGSIIAFWFVDRALRKLKGN